MKKLNKAVILTSMITVGAMSIVGSASEITKKIEAYIHPGISVTMDGEKQIFTDRNGKALQPIIHEGRTYLPVKNLAELTGMNVVWDQNTQTVVLEHKDLDKTIGKIEVKENPTTGYAWNYDIKDKDIIQVVSDNYKEDKLPDGVMTIAGAGGSHTWVIKSLKEGTTTIKFSNQRTWEGDKSTVETKEFIVTVSSDLEVKIEENNNVYTGGSKYFDEVTGLYKSIGKVKSLQQGKGGIMALVEGEGQYDQINFNIGPQTKILTPGGYRLTVNDIKEGSRLEVFYGPKMSRSLPPIATAEKVVVKDTVCRIGEVAKVSQTKHGYSIYVGDEANFQNSIVYHVGKNTEIVDIFGEKVSIEDIKEGTEIKAFSGLVMTMSLPPQTSAKKIVVDIPYSEGAIAAITKTERGTFILVDNKIRFNIDEDMEIVNKDGQKLTIDDLKKGVKVKAYYDGKTTRSLPPIGTAEKLVVTSETNKHPLVGRYMNKVDDKHIDVLGGDIAHRVNIEKVAEDLKAIAVDSTVQIDTEMIDGIEYATSIKIFKDTSGIKFDTMGNRIN